VNLGPVFPSLKIPGLVAQNGTGLNYNPRCLRRDISKEAAKWTTTEQVVDLIKNETDIWDYETTMQGDFPSGFLGLHSGGHYTIGGDPGGVSWPFLILYLHGVNHRRFLGFLCFPRRSGFLLAPRSH
jgi:tyrosinase